MEIRNFIRLYLIKEIKLTGKVLYLHGLGSNPEKDNVEAVNVDAVNVEIISPKLNYKKEPLYQYLSDLIEKHKIKGIIGHSIGGYLAFILSNDKKIPCLMFNPAFEDEDLKFQPIPKKNNKPFHSQMAVVGNLDDEILPEIQLKNLKNTNCIIFKEKIGHDIPLEIKQKYIKLFLSKFNIN